MKKFRIKFKVSKEIRGEFTLWNPWKNVLKNSQWHFWRNPCFELSLSLSLWRIFQESLKELLRKSFDGFPNNYLKKIIIKDLPAGISIQENYWMKCLEKYREKSFDWFLNSWITSRGSSNGILWDMWGKPPDFFLFFYESLKEFLGEFL